MLRHKRRPEEREREEQVEEIREEEQQLPHKRLHLDHTPPIHRPRRPRKSSASYPFSAFSKLHISNSGNSNSSISNASQYPAQLQAPIPVRPSPDLIASLPDQIEEPTENDIEDESIASTSPPASPQFLLNPALAAHLAANHPFGGLKEQSEPLLPPPFLQKPLSPSVSSDAGALILYKPLKPKPAFVRAEDEEREDEETDEEDSAQMGGGQAEEEYEEAHAYFSRRSHTSRSHGRTHSDSRSGPRIIELENENEQDVLRDDNLVSENKRRSSSASSASSMPSYVVESPSSSASEHDRGSSTAPFASTFQHAYSPVIDLSKPDLLDQAQFFQQQTQPPSFAPDPVITDLITGEMLGNSGSATPMSTSASSMGNASAARTTEAANTPIDYSRTGTPVHFIPNDAAQLQAEHVFGLADDAEVAPMDLD